MLIVHGYERVPEAAKGTVLAIGNFDGVHKGHQALIEVAKKSAQRDGRRAGVLLFEPHPREFFKPSEPHFRLCSLAETLEILDGFGVDVAIVLPFDAALARLEGGEFVERVLVNALAVHHVVVGYHFFYGRNRSGSVETLRAAGTRLGFAVTVVEPVAEGGDVFSSTSIRLKIAEGNVRAAASDLGRPWRVKGTVVGGARRGTGMGFPTANVPLRPGTTLGHGIYAVRVTLDGQHLEGAAYLGTRPTFDDGAPVLEVFLFDFSGDIYGHEIEVSFIDRVRGDRKFSGVDELIAQMQADCAKAREILALTG